MFIEKPYLFSSRSASAFEIDSRVPTRELMLSLMLMSKSAHALFHCVNRMGSLDILHAVREVKGIW